MDGEGEAGRGGGAGFDQNGLCAGLCLSRINFHNEKNSSFYPLKKKEKETSC